MDFRIFDNWWLDAPITIAIITITLLFPALAKKTDKNLYKALLLNSSAVDLYQKKIQFILGYVSTKLVPYNDEDCPFEGKSRIKKLLWLTSIQSRKRTTAFSAASQSFGWPLLDFALLFAFLYPTFLICLTWLMSGGTVEVGGIPILVETSWWNRPIILTSMVLLLPSFYRGLPLKLRIGLLLIGLVLALVAAIAGTIAIEGPLAVAIAVAVALAGAIAAVGNGAFTGAGSIGVTLAATGSIVGLAEGAITGIGAIVGIAAVGYFTRKNYYLPAYSLAIAVTLCVLALAVVQTSSIDSAVIIVLLGLVPLTNGIFDYGSYGLTRLLLRLGLKSPKRAWIYGISDLFAALAFFSALGVTLVVGLSGINHLRGSVIVDVSKTLSEMADPQTRWNHWWIYVMLLSTVVPTALHTSIAITSLVATIPQALKSSLIHSIDRSHRSDTHRFLTSIFLGITCTTALLTPIYILFGLGHVFRYFFPAAAGWYLSFLQWLAIVLY